MTDEPNATEIEAWARLQRASRRMLESAEVDLKAAGLPPLVWYDALLELKRAGPDGLRPVALQEAMLLAQYNVSRLADRLEQAGLVARAPCAGDGRGHVLCLTPAGEAMLARIWPVYRAAISRHFASALRPGDAARLDEILAPLARVPER